MFTDQQTGMDIFADLDSSVIHGTLRNCDLVPAFLDVIQDTAEYEQIIDTNNWKLHVITDPTADENDERWETDDMCALVEELFDVLMSYAPDGYYFGTTEGDGSDFGYWKIVEDEPIAVDGDIICIEADKETHLEILLIRQDNLEVIDKFSIVEEDPSQTEVDEDGFPYDNIYNEVKKRLTNKGLLTVK